MQGEPWDGVPKDPEHPAWHWLLLHGDDDPTVCDWLPKRRMWHMDAGIFDPAFVASQADYLGPCCAPAEVAALVAAARREGMEMAAGICMGLANPWIEEASRQADWQREGAAQCERAIRAAMGAGA